MDAEGERGSKSLKEKAVDRREEKRSSSSQVDVQVTEKPPLLQRLRDGVVHTVTGFRLFVNNVRVSTKLLMKSVRGDQLSRRESKLVSLLTIN